jgi:hypothetical protein
LNGGNPDLSGQCVFSSSQPLKDFLRYEPLSHGDCEHDDGDAGDLNAHAGQIVAELAVPAQFAALYG